MAKKKEEIVPGPNPLPKVGDVVAYTWPPNLIEIKKSGQTVQAKVTFVYEGFDGRLVDLEAQDTDKLIAVKSAPWRDDEAGNTWHAVETPA
jgi:hypothetical protein